ncbi:MAG: type VI secretion system-associated FHA domain protein [Alphaproteobacteria bacterium]|nr:type VI secretion system-associated FHA domain protein [Alphaproteobacteria bacterium]
MHTLKLYHSKNPGEPLDTRTLEHGDLAIGRDANAGWTIADPTAQISRLHCILAVADGRLTLQDLSANGVFIDDEYTRAPHRDPTILPEHAKLFLGPFMITVEPNSDASPSQTQIGEAPSLCRPAVFSMDALSIPDDWTAIVGQEVSVEPRPVSPDEVAKKPSPAFAAFCAGAKLDPREFAEEDEADVMRRVGAVYQATVIGLSTLMNQRQVAKQDFGIDKTKIGQVENNPFKFSATSRLGADVLRHHKRGFLTGPEAVRAAFVDVKKHLISMLAGSRAILTSALNALGPERIDQSLRGESFFLGSKGAAAWKEYERVYAAFRMEVLTNPSGSVDAAFRAAYARQLQELEEASTLCEQRSTN